MKKASHSDKNRIVDLSRILSKINKNLLFSISMSYQNKKRKFQSKKAPRIIIKLKLNYTIKIKIQFAMKRFFFRPFFDMNDAFYPLKRIFGPTHKHKYSRNSLTAGSSDKPEKTDPHTIFNQFFKQHQLKDEIEKEFFKKHFPQEKQEKFDPYKVLEINNDASIDQAKEAYRKLAIKYHPKNNTASDAQAKFAQIGKAYQTIIQDHNAKNQDILGFRSFFEDFEKQIDSIFSLKPLSQSTQQMQSQKQIKEGGKKEHQNQQLYSESTSYESVDGQQTHYKTQKIYKKNGKLIKASREEKLKDDGNMEITQTIDNGNQVKRKKFLQEKGEKKKVIQAQKTK